MCLRCCLCLYRLSEQTQKALESVGSSYSKQISFRDAWAFIGRPQLNGYSPFEEVWTFSMSILICFTSSTPVFTVFPLPHDLMLHAPLLILKHLVFSLWLWNLHVLQKPSITDCPFLADCLEFTVVLSNAN